MKKYGFPMFQRNGMYLAPWSGGNVSGFIHSFRTSWSRFPLAVRRLICRHWRNDPRRTSVDYILPEAAGKADKLVSPRIELHAVWERPRNEYASVRASGHHLSFFEPLVMSMPEIVRQDLIGHELAYVYQQAVGYEVLFDKSPMLEHEIEMHADDLITEWGFDATSVDRWADPEGYEQMNCVERAIGRYGSDVVSSQTRR